jgi:DNA polymerase-1
MIVEVLINNGLGNPYFSYKELVNKYCAVTLDKEIRNDFINNYNIQLTQEHLLYSSLDVEYLSKIKEKQIKIITEQGQVRIMHLENALTPVIANMELTGVNINVEKWKELYTNLGIEIDAKRKEIKHDLIENILKTKYTNCYDLTQVVCIPVKTKKLTEQLKSLSEQEAIASWLEENININSNKQLLAVLTKIYNIDVKNTNEKTINKLSKGNPIIDKIMYFREMHKKYSTYGEKFLGHIHPLTGKIHCTYNQVGAASGRLTSDDPNMQNIIRGSAYRECFHAPEGYKFLVFDYEQQELRIIASLSREPTMTDAFQKGIDIHTLTSEKVHVSRPTAKNINFAMIYGSTEYGLYKNFSIPLEDGRRYLQELFETYPQVVTFKKSVSSFVLKNLYSRTLMGRKRFFKDRHLFESYKDEQKWIGSIQREGTNHTVQGSSADCTKLAMITLAKENPFGDDYKLVLQVHDEVIILIKDEIAQRAFDFTNKILLDTEQKFLVAIPAKVKGNISQVWTKD